MKTCRRPLLIGAACCAVLACSSDRVQGPSGRNPLAASLRSGGDQRAVAGEILPDPVAILVTNQRGQPLAGIGVEWTAVQDSDVVSPAHSTTQDNGVAETVWTLGPLPGEHTLIARVAGYGTVTIRANADPAPLAINAVHVLNLDTPDGSGQTVHPDYVNVPNGPLAGDYLAITPYPFGDFHYENPSVYTSLDRAHWSAPPGATNPVALPDVGYLSDPDILYNPDTQELWLYYRRVDALTDVMLIRSKDAVQWSIPEVVSRALNHFLVAPSVVRRSATEWLMWSINGQSGCDAPETWVELRRSPDGLDWSPPVRVALTQAGFTPWHIDVQWIPGFNQYWAIYNVKPPGSCTTPALYLATSPDGVTWTTHPSPVLARGDIAVFDDIVYRSTFRYRPETDAITFWYSGAQYNGLRYVWRTAVQRRERAEVFATVNGNPSAALITRLARVVPVFVDSR
jgi:hypothetical protein